MQKDQTQDRPGIYVRLVHIEFVPGIEIVPEIEIVPGIEIVPRIEIVPGILCILLQRLQHF